MTVNAMRASVRLKTKVVLMVLHWPAAAHSYFKVDIDSLLKADMTAVYGTNAVRKIFNGITIGSRGGRAWLTGVDKMRKRAEAVTSSREPDAGYNLPQSVLGNQQVYDH
ncbi:hypothetical protein BDY19DRAFT_906265 [Irpex rosettiformis]|uniref:Uncharacterized protein n=1 Tax=Irpex rosettiformis TaxID=378272 RepID=A0ACB8U3I6_9APHY|nr:hypothetical protein BDY19DRAFT_906265 [Irpex rosettiformis]